ncbi:helix-turn-helix transcriptional regulator [Roseateles sp. SL47]|uniref:helix-turn-helix domain-containing protein n=1 Tax=Roseateles sp. SL47 TaxID=2995138 RepID=UPI00226ECA1A|nr:helix-turn-helix transcriptional regulator [Roseateles sp. SL47]WAC75027.1 helix-turn-helix transcriptional regulator [Roseateles sp. SL47]
MAQGKRISAEIDAGALLAIRQLGASARAARMAANESQGAAAARLGVHVQTIGRIESGESGVAIGHVYGMLALYGILPPASVATVDTAMAQVSHRSHTTDSASESGSD